MSSVLVLLAVYQGEPYLEEQLKSLANQTFETVHVLASDDGSTDRSMEILQAAQATWIKGRFEIVSGRQKGFARNFRSLLENSMIDADCFAFCDQDDVWKSEKLEQAVRWLSSVEPEVPAVYSSRSNFVDSDTKFITQSTLLKKKLTFQNALMECPIQGHTMVMNRAARELLVRTAIHISPISHDRWTYLIVTGSGGSFHYDATPIVCYRQHEGNVYGGRRPWYAPIWRLNQDGRRRSKLRTARYIRALNGCSEMLTPSARITLRHLEDLHNGKTAAQRWRAISQSGMYRQSQRGQLAMMIDSILGSY